MSEPAEVQETDPVEFTFDAVREITGLDPDEELLGDPEHRAEYQRLKAEYLARQAEGKKG